MRLIAFIKEVLGLEQPEPMTYGEYACSLIGLHPTEIPGYVRAYLRRYYHSVNDEIVGEVPFVIVEATVRPSLIFRNHDYRRDGGFIGTNHSTRFSVPLDKWDEALAALEDYNESIGDENVRLLP